MRHWKILGSVALLVTSSCSSATEDARPTSCSKSDRTGTYQQTMTRVSGTCPNVGPQVVQLTDGVATSAGVAGGSGGTCTTVSARWTENDCKFESAVDCTNPDSTSRAVGVTRQVTEDGSRLEGTSTITVRLLSGESCTGTYSLVAIRQ